MSPQNIIAYLCKYSVFINFNLGISRGESGDILEFWVAFLVESARKLLTSKLRKTQVGYVNYVVASMFYVVYSVIEVSFHFSVSGYQFTGCCVCIYLRN